MADYLAHFELVRKGNDLDDTTAALELATSLRDSAQGVLIHLGPVELANYQTLVTALTNRFEPGNFKEVYRADLKNRVRHHDEKLVDLAADVKKLVQKAYLGESRATTDRIGTESFIDALNDHDMEWAVYKTKRCSLDEALQYAIEYEAFHRSRGSRSPIPAGR